MGDMHDKEIDVLSFPSYHIFRLCFKQSKKKLYVVTVFTLHPNISSVSLKKSGQISQQQSWC